MKKHDYWFGETKCYAYHKTVGHGFEVGFYFGKQAVFVGNFIHAREAAHWFAQINRETRKFAKRYSVGEEVSMTWYSKFFSHHLYKAYYKYLDTEFSKYQKTFDKACKTDEKKYYSFKKNWDTRETYRFVKAA